MFQSHEGCGGHTPKIFPFFRGCNPEMNGQNIRSSDPEFGGNFPGVFILTIFIIVEFHLGSHPRLYGKSVGVVPPFKVQKANGLNPGKWF